MEVALESNPSQDSGHGLELVSQANELSRGVAMKQMVGPLLSEFMRPMYETPITPEETDRIHATDNLGHLSHLGGKVIDILHQRLDSRVHEDQEGYENINKLISNAGLFYYQVFNGVLTEGIRTGVATPLRVATQVYRLEWGDSPGGHNFNFIKSDDLDHSYLLEILERDSFNDMLHRLAKGPNGYLTDVDLIERDTFFEFRDRDGHILMYWDALRLNDEGKVDGLSDKFHIAGQGRRERIRHNNKREPAADHTSSGCPVRYKSEDDSGEAHDSLITASTKFLTAALAISASKSVNSYRLRALRAERASRETVNA
jgi:hypothetical protein